MFSETAELYDRLYSWKDYAAETAKLLELIAAAGGPASGSLLDVACGTGKHLELLREHYAVEGIDLDDELLAVARRRLPEVPLHHADMRGFDLGRRFDVVTCLFSSIGYTRTAEAMRAAVACMARHVAPGGVLAIEPWFTADTIRDRNLGLLTIDDPELRVVRMAYNTVHGATNDLLFEYLVGTPDGIRRATEHHEMGLFSLDEMRGAVEATGLRASYDPDGLAGRGLHLGVAPADAG